MTFPLGGLLDLLAVSVCRQVEAPSELLYQWFSPALERRQHRGRFPKRICTSVSEPVRIAAIANTNP